MTRLTAAAIERNRIHSQAWRARRKRETALMTAKGWQWSTWLQCWVPVRKGETG